MPFYWPPFKSGGKLKAQTLSLLFKPGKRSTAFILPHTHTQGRKSAPGHFFFFGKRGTFPFPLFRPRWLGSRQGCQTVHCQLLLPTSLIRPKICLGFWGELGPKNGREIWVCAGGLKETPFWYAFSVPSLPPPPPPPSIDIFTFH